MDDGDRIRIVGGGDPASRPAGRGALLLAALAAVGGLTLGYLVASTTGLRPADRFGSTAVAGTTTTDPGPTARHNPDPAVASPPAPTSPAVRTPRDLLPGFDATMHLTADGAVLLWNPGMAAPVSYPLPRGADGTSASWDVAGEWLAYEARGASDRTVLWVGRLAAQNPLFIGVDDFAWHADQQGLLAFIGSDPETDAPYLYTAVASATGVADTRLSALPVDDAAVATRWRIAGWGSWGFAVTRYDDPGIQGDGIRLTTILVDTDGSITTVAPGVAVDSVSPGGFLAVHDQDGYRITGPDLSVQDDFPLVGDPWGLSFSHDDRYAAAWQDRGSIAVVSRESGPIPYPAPAGHSFSWSRDGRYLAFLTFNDRQRVQVLDLATGDRASLDPGVDVWSITLG